MEWKIEDEDFLHFTRSTENHFRIFMRYAENFSDPNVKSKLAIVTVDANIVFERYIADLGFNSLDEINAVSRLQNRSLLDRVEHLHGGANETRKDIDFVRFRSSAWKTAGGTGRDISLLFGSRLELHH